MKLILLPLLIALPLWGISQQRTQAQIDSAIAHDPKFNSHWDIKPEPPKYVFDEPTVISISNILSMANDLAATSDKLSTNQYNEYIKAIRKIDSVLVAQWNNFHPQPKGENK